MGCTCLHVGGSTPWNWYVLAADSAAVLPPAGGLTYASPQQQPNLEENNQI